MSGVSFMNSRIIQTTSDGPEVLCGSPWGPFHTPGDCELCKRRHLDFNIPMRCALVLHPMDFVIGRRCWILKVLELSSFVSLRCLRIIKFCTSVHPQSSTHTFGAPEILM